jgi:hypothetical protein
MIVRVCLKSTNDETGRIRFDINVGDDMRPLPNIAYFGFYGPLKDTEFSNGVLLTSEGVIDMGYGFEISGRFHKTNLLNKKIELGGYVTVWWKWDAEPSEETYVIEAVTALSAVTQIIQIQKATSFLLESINNLPRFRARVVRPFDIEGYDGVVYRPPVGVEGDVAYFQGCIVFCPDDAVSESGDLITASVEPSDIELIVDKCNSAIMAGLDKA